MTSRKASKGGWKAKLNEAKENLGGNLPWLLRTELGEWVDLWVQPHTLEADAKNDKGWSCFMIEMQTEEGGDWSEHEIPFWCKESFTEILDEADEDESVVGLRYKRLQSGKDNYAKWKLQEE